jgi:hypothetical protein
MLVQELDAVSDPAVKSAVKELVAAVMELNSAAFERVLAVAARYGQAGVQLMEVLVREEAVSSLLILQGLHPQDLHARVRSTLENFPGVQLISIDGGELFCAWNRTSVRSPPCAKPSRPRRRI